MSKPASILIDEIAQELQDTSHTIWSDTAVTGELAIQLEDALREVSDYVPYIRMQSFKLESRTGTDTAGDSKKLTDTTESQFNTLGDDDKVIHNIDDETWAIATARDSADVLSISKDIMDEDEDYELFNKGCVSTKQINIEDVIDYVGANHGVIAVEYPIGSRRNFSVEGDILTIDYAGSIPDSDITGTTQPDIEVLVWFNTVQRVVQFADWAGTVSGTPAEGAETFTIAAVGSGTDVIGEDVLFAVAGIRGTYAVRYALTLSGGGGSLVFLPGLESAGTNGAIVSFIGSTLDNRLERLIVELTAARALISKANAELIQAKTNLNTGLALINTINKGGAGGIVPEGYRAYARAEEELANNRRGMGETKLSIVLSKLERLRPRRTKRSYSAG